MAAPQIGPRPTAPLDSVIVRYAAPAPPPAGVAGIAAATGPRIPAGARPIDTASNLYKVTAAAGKTAAQTAVELSAKPGE